jgi:GNAT superfamily N-acetyltransferase
MRRGRQIERAAPFGRRGRRQRHDDVADAVQLGPARRAVQRPEHRHVADPRAQAPPVVVEQAERGRGVGTALVRAAMREARALGHDRLSLTTYRDLAWNGPFYAGLGFVETAHPEPFELLLQKSGRRLQVPAERSATDVLADAGLAIDVKCSDGLCGVCAVPYDAQASGEVEHRDFVLSQKERQHKIILCCSRAKQAKGIIALDF